MKWMIGVLVIGLGSVSVVVGQQTPPCDSLHLMNPCNFLPVQNDCCQDDPCADCKAAWVEEMANIWVRGFRGYGDQPDSCIVFVKYRVRRCSTECCELQIDWLMPECMMCQFLHNVLGEAQKQIARYLLNGVCWTGPDDDFELVMRRPFCWGQTSTPPPDMPVPPQGWTGQERWIVPCPDQPTCCFRIQYQVTNWVPCPDFGQSCRTEQPNQPPCPPECPYRGCCPVP